jgi:very-short-patch-repair endonuclease
LERRVLRQLEALGLPVRTEVPAGRWSIDFVVGALAIEADGDYWHGKPGVRERDARRDAELRTAGYTVLRFSESEIDADPQLVAATVASVLLAT